MFVNSWEKRQQIKQKGANKKKKKNNLKALEIKR